MYSNLLALAILFSPLYLSFASAEPSISLVNRKTGMTIPGFEEVTVDTPINRLTLKELYPVLEIRSTASSLPPAVLHSRQGLLRFRRSGDSTFRLRSRLKRGTLKIHLPGTSLYSGKVITVRITQRKSTENNTPMISGFAMKAANQRGLKLIEPGATHSISTEQAPSISLSAYANHITERIRIIFKKINFRTTTTNATENQISYLLTKIDESIPIGDLENGMYRISARAFSRKNHGQTAAFFLQVNPSANQSEESIPTTPPTPAKTPEQSAPPVNTPPPVTPSPTHTATSTPTHTPGTIIEVEPVANPTPTATPTQTPTNTKSPTATRTPQITPPSPTTSITTEQTQESTSLAAAQSLEDIPLFSQWFENMISAGEQVCLTMEQDLSFDEALSTTYYDGQRTFQQIAKITKDSSWLRCANLAEAIYRDTYVLPNQGQVPGYWAFTDGLLEDYINSGDSRSGDAILSIADRAGFHSDLTPVEATRDHLLQREVAYAIKNLLNAEKMGKDVTERLKTLVDHALGHFDQQFNEDLSGAKPFMVGLAAEALIAFNQRFPDKIILETLTHGLDKMWDAAWLPESRSFMYAHSTSESERSGAPDLNLLIAPAYAWVYHQTGLERFKSRADLIFSAGLEGAYLERAKQFNQNYRWSHQYFIWRFQTIF